MHPAGVLPADAPDPRKARIEELRQMPVPILGLIPQPNIEDWDAVGAEVGTCNGILDHIVAAVSYTLWRNPTDRDDPANLAELDDETRRALDAQPPWPRPDWLIDQVQRMRYPMLWEAVRTSWHRNAADKPTAATELVQHANHVLRNSYHLQSSNRPAHPERRLEQQIQARAIEHRIPVSVNGAMINGIHINTDQHVYALGADLGSGGILTAVIDRAALPYLKLEFVTRPMDG